MSNGKGSGADVLAARDALIRMGARERERALYHSVRSRDKRQSPKGGVLSDLMALAQFGDANEGRGARD